MAAQSPGRGAGDAGRGGVLVPSPSEKHTSGLWWPWLGWAEAGCRCPFGSASSLLGGWALREQGQKVKVQLGIIK